jgi:branched-chain amino acid transport system substrate-binding protein
VVKAIVEEIRAFDQQKFKDKLHNDKLCIEDYPGILTNLRFDKKGDIDGESFLVKIEHQKRVMPGILPPIHPEWFPRRKK